MPDERHYSPQEIAQRWHVSPQWVRRRFAHERGVVRLGYNWRISESALQRVYQQSMVRPEPVRLPKTRARRLPDGSVALVPRADSVAR